MKPQDLPSAATDLEQVYLLERDPNLLCRILGLYAARGVEVLRVNYAYAAQHVMQLDVRVFEDSTVTADSVHVLVEKVATFPGVIAAAEHSRSRGTASCEPVEARGDPTADVFTPTGRRDALL